ncbi:unnamed protein product [Cuscuta europaea]|uniref:Uncharacterized protein n=1 Tax=Cuscuta europaea TaxID=41803 RepID=A0A9P0Z4I9_CUSEU|nr:unnamed protein product [Cuscuta europaea]
MRKNSITSKNSIRKHLDIVDIKWIRGQLLIYLVGCNVSEINDNVGKDMLVFHIQNRLVSFSKDKFCMITCLSFIGDKEIENSEEGDIWSRYFQQNKKRSLYRGDVGRAFKNFNREDSNARPSDGVKLTLLYVLSNQLLGN